MPEVSIIIVCMNRPDNLFPCLDSIRLHTRVSYETLVVAYMFSKGNLEDLKNRYPWVSVIESQELRGFSENNNLALRQAKGKYCFVVNDDTWMKMPVIDALVADFSQLPAAAAAVQPATYYPDGRPQMCGRADWTPWFYLKHYFHLADETHPTKWTYKQGLFKTGTINGACFLIKTDVFRDAGWFDETYTFTPEDVALGLLLRQKGMDIYTDSQTSIIHIGNATASRLTPAIKPTKVRGSLILFSNYHHLSSPQGTACKNRFTYWALALSIGLFECLRGIKYSLLPKSLSDNASPQERYRAIMAITSKNVRSILFSKESPKDIFTRFYKQIIHE